MNQEKILKSSTIIPSHLYVERNADRQIKKILEEMGRPGYILVARQLGKTNLLLHTKCSLENEKCIFVYVDLSNIFENERDCFRNIIDTAIDTHITILGEVKSEINKLRQGDHYTPQKEHEKELRILLNKTPAKIAIFLDEIDALSNTSFSDKIFAQIRSIYFTRINYSEYKRLTYILSGVLEPSEIINNKNISPFNIGEKIYLDDFTKEEYHNFITKTSLQFEDDIIDRVFYWASGNPRITWDIISELENILLETGAVNLDHVDNTIKKLYLKDIAAAPIDHIRDLVQNNKDIRDAIIEIKFGKGISLKDEIKRKLYLAGIIKSYFETDQITIKNEVIAKSLSDRWLRSIEMKEKSLLELAVEKYYENKYQESIILYEDYLKEKEFDKQSGPLCYFQLGSSYYFTKKYNEAIIAFRACPFDKKRSASSYFHELYFLGLCHFYIEDYESSIKAFEEIVEEDKGGDYYFESLLNLAGALTKIDWIKNKEKIIQINTDILERLNAPDREVNEEKENSLKTISYFNLGKAYEKINDSKNAIKNFRNASDYCDIHSKPRILFELYSQESDRKLQLKTLSDIINIVIENNLVPEKFSLETPLRFDEILYYDILIDSFMRSRNELFLVLFKFTLKVCFTDDKPYDIFSKLGLYLIYSKRLGEAKEVIIYFLEKYEKDIKDRNFLNDWYRLCTLHFGLKKYKAKYFSLFTSDYPDKFSPSDLQIFANEISLLLKTQKYDEAFQLISNTYHYYSTFDKSQQIDYSLIMYYELIFYQYTNDISNANQLAQLLIDFIELKKSHLNKGSLLGINQINIILDHAREYIASKIKKDPIKSNHKKIGRNDIVKVKYNDGTIISIKFKKVTMDIENGLCIIISDNTYPQLKEHTTAKLQE